MFNSTRKVIGKKMGIFVVSAATALVPMAYPGTSSAGPADPCVKNEKKINAALDSYQEKTDKIIIKLNAAIDKINFKSREGCEMYEHSTCDDFDVTELPPSDKTDPCFKSRSKRDKACRKYFAGLDKADAKLEDGIDTLNKKAEGNGCPLYELFTCTDTDPDNLPAAQGLIVQTMIQDTFIAEDECADSTTLSQINCDGEGQTQEELYACEYQGEGTIDTCNAGACYPGPINEVDVTVGQALIDLDWEDSAHAIEYVVECSCGAEILVNESEAIIMDVDLEETHIFTITPYNDAGAGQSFQAMYEPQPAACYDLDPNNLIGKKGTIVQTIDEEYFAYHDQCEADGIFLKQFNCGGTGAIQEELYACEYQGEGTTDTCNNGACYPGSVSSDNFNITGCTGTAVELDWEDAWHARKYSVYVSREISPGNWEFLEEDFTTNSYKIFYGFKSGTYLFSITPHTDAGAGAVSTDATHVLE